MTWVTSGDSYLQIHLHWEALEVRILAYKPWGHISQPKGLPWWLSGKESTCNAGVVGSVPGSGRSPGGGNGYPLQYSCLGNPMDRGVWWATVHGVTKELDHDWPTKQQQEQQKSSQNTHGGWSSGAWGSERTSKMWWHMFPEGGRQGSAGGQTPTWGQLTCLRQASRIFRGFLVDGFGESQNSRGMVAVWGFFFHLTPLCLDANS